MSSLQARHLFLQMRSAILFIVDGCSAGTLLCHRSLADKVGGVVGIAAALIHGLVWIGA
jgi:hypothetical protein